MEDLNTPADPVDLGSEAVQWSLSGSPISGLMPGTLLMVGCERGPKDTLVYLGSRSHGAHIHVTGETAEQCHMAWEAGGSPHLWAQGIPVDALCVCKPMAELNDQGKEALG